MSRGGRWWSHLKEGGDEVPPVTPRPSPHSNGVLDASDDNGVRLRVRVRRRRMIPRPLLLEEEDPTARHSETSTGAAPSYHSFVRLPRHVVQRLVVAHHGTSLQDRHRRSPAAALLDHVADADFLPLWIQFESTSDVVYGSFNGGELTHSHRSQEARYPLDGDSMDDEIELPEVLIPSTLGGGTTCSTGDTSSQRYIDENLYVRVKVVEGSSCQDAREIRVRALSPDDYSLLQHSAPYLEGGGWLRQLSVVYPGQVLAVQTWDECDWAYCRVVSGGDGSFGGGDDGDGRLVSVRGKSLCYRLVATTQVVVLPPSDAEEDTGAEEDGLMLQDKSAVTLSIFPGMLDYNRSIRDLAEHLDVTLVSVEQGCAAVHPNVFAPWIVESLTGSSQKSSRDGLNEGFLALLECMHSADDDDESSIDASSRQQVSKDHPRRVIVRLTPSLSVPISGIVLHPLTRLDLKLDSFVDSITIKHLPIEKEVRIGHIRDQILECSRSRTIQLSLERVIIRPRRTDQPWRFPDFAMVQKQESDFSLKLSEENPSLKVPDELRNIPLRIGALISLPFTSSTLFNCAASFPSSHRCLYRLIVTDNTDHTEAVDNDDEEDDYVFTQDVVDLLRLPGVESAQCEYLREAAIDGIDQTDVLYSSCPNVRSSSALSSYGLPNTVPSTLVYGEIGSGKTYTALLLAAMSHLLNKRSITYLDCRRLKNTQGLRLEGIMDEILFAFQHATAPTPSVIILDDLDELVPHTETDHSSENRNVQPYNPTLVDQCHALAGLVRHLLRSAWDSGADLKVVITAKDPECLSGSVRDDLMDTQLARLPLLSEKDRIELFHAFLDRLGVQRYDSVSKLHDPGVTKALGFGPKTTGFRPLDLLQLAERLKSAFTSYVSSDSLRLLEKVLRDYVPLSQRAALIEYIQHEYSMDDVGGLLNAKQELATTMLRPARYRRIYQHADLRLPRGILLFGPPGCGKSFVVPALAGECGYPLIMCRGAELLDKYIGASEMKVRELFSRAASVAPSLLWLDELDALAPRRGSDSTGVTDRIVNQLLTLLDGVEDTSVSGTIYVVGTSSRPDKIDPALLRPGRLERHVYVGLPESVDELKEVLIKLSEKFSLSEGLRESLHSGEFLAVLNDKVKDLKLLSPADARAAFVSAQIAAARAAIDEGVDRDRQDQVPTVTAEQLLEAFRSTRPSIGQADRTMLDAIYSNFRKISSRPTGQSQANIVSNDLKVALM